MRGKAKETRARMRRKEMMEEEKLIVKKVMEVVRRKEWQSRRRRLWVSKEGKKQRGDQIYLGLFKSPKPNQNPHPRLSKKKKAGKCGSIAPSKTLTLRTLNPLIRQLSPLSTAAAAAAAAVSDDLPPPLEFHYLDGFPRPDPKHAETILAIPRSKSGRLIAAKEREFGRIPSIIFEQENGQEGGNKRLISVRTKQIKKLVDHVGYSFFLSRLFEIEVRSEFGENGELIEKVRVLPRKLHLHSGTDAVLNVTFIRAPSSALLRVDVPLVFRGDDVCPGLRKGAYLNTIKRTVKYLCPADIIPPYIDVDLSELDIGQKLLMRDLKVHPALKLLHPLSQPVCNIIGSRGAEQKKSK